MVFRAAENPAELLDQFQDIIVELGEFAVQRDFDLGWGGRWQDDGFKRLTAAIGLTPP